MPPFTLGSATQKVRLAEDAWNSRDPTRVAQGYSVDSRWRNRAEFLQGREAIEAFLTRKLFYNSLGVPIAAGVLYPFTGLLLSPMIAALEMSLSLVSVVSNALRLRRTRLPS